MFKVHGDFCSGDFILEKESNSKVSCICQNKPKNMPYSTLVKCSKGHRTWMRSRSEVCLECQKERTINAAKKFLEIQSNLNRSSIEESIIETNRIFYLNKEKLFLKSYKK